MPVFGPVGPTNATDSTVFIDSNGGSHNLGDATGVDLDGAGGRFMPPMTFLETPVPGVPGTRLDAVQVGARNVSMKVVVQGIDPAHTRQSLRALCDSMNPSNGDGTLQVTAPDGVVRNLTCRLAGGLLGPPGGSSGVGAASPEELLGTTRGPTFQIAVLTFRAFDPYWYDATPTTASWAQGLANNPFFPFFPLDLNPSFINVTSNVTVLGDVECYPVWTVTGPADALTVSNNTTGQSFTVVSSVLAGTTLTVDCRRGHKSVLDNLGNNQFGNLAFGSSLFPLEPGVNSITVQAANTTTSSGVALSYSNAWLTP